MSKIFGFNYGNNLSAFSIHSAVYSEDVLHSENINNCLFSEEWVLDYSCTELGRFKTGDLEWMPRRAMTAHLYPPRTLYREQHTGTAGTSCYFVFRGDMPVLRRLTTNSAGFAEIEDPSGKLLKCIKDGASAASKGNAGYWQCCVCFAQAMEILENLSPSAAGDWQYKAVDRHEYKSRCRKALEFMEKNFPRSISVNSVARAAGCSESTLAHEFKKEYGETVLDRLQKIRIEQSLPHLLRSGNIKEAAAASGFSNEFYYSRVFRKVMGTPPGAYRKLREVF